MANVKLLYRVDIGLDQERGYGAVVCAIGPENKVVKRKGIKANSIRQLCRRIHEAVCEDDQMRRRFPLETEAQSVPSIITPGNGDPLFNELS